MKDLLKLIGVIALAAIIGFTMAACKDDDDPPPTPPGGGGGGVGTGTGTGTGTGGNTPHVFTITNIPQSILDACRDGGIVALFPASTTDAQIEEDFTTLMNNSTSFKYLVAGEENMQPVPGGGNYTITGHLLSKSSNFTTGWVADGGSYFAVIAGRNSLVISVWKSKTMTLSGAGPTVTDAQNTSDWNQIRP